MKDREIEGHGTFEQLCRNYEEAFVPYACDCCADTPPSCPSCTHALGWHQCERDDDEDEQDNDDVERVDSARYLVATDGHSSPWMAKSDSGRKLTSKSRPFWEIQEERKQKREREGATSRDEGS